MVLKKAGRHKRDPNRAANNAAILATIETEKSCENTDRAQYSRPPVPGDIVTIIVKPYCSEIYVTGTVLKTLTKKAVHTRGHKVRLVNGIVGRTIKIVEYV